MRFHIISMAVAFIILCGCKSERPTALRQEETPIPGTPGGNDGYYGMLYVSDGQELRTGHELEMDDNDVNACLVDKGGILMLENIQIMKSGDATGMVVSGGGHAACAVRNGGKLYINGKGSIFTDG